LANEFATALLERLEHEQNERAESLIIAEFSSALSAASRKFEVVIFETEWDRYLKSHAIEEPGRTSKAKSGRRQKEGWRSACVIIGAYLIAYIRQRPGSFPKNEDVGTTIFEIGRREEIPDFPAAATIRDVMSEIRSKAEQISTK
jgi:hypothetical protein